MDKLLSDIKTMKIQGAREVAKAGLDYVSKKAKNFNADNKEKFQKLLLEEINRVIKIRPTEPMLINSLARIAVEFEKADIKGVPAMKSFVAQRCSNQRSEIQSMLRAIAVNGAKEIDDGDVIMTHCHSHDVMAIFAEAKRQKKDFKVIVTETRPLYQGLKTAKELLKMGVRIKYGEDSIMAHCMKETTKILVGCDAILHDGSIANKIGTFPIAIVAKEFDRPFLVAGETLKMTEHVQIEQRPLKEVIDPKKLLGAEIINPAFDITPGNLVTAIITERGKLLPSQLEFV